MTPKALFLLLLLPLVALAADPGVVPNPASLTRQAGTLRIDARTTLVVAPDDAGARRVAENLAGLIRRTHGLRIAVQSGDAGKGSIRLQRLRDADARAGSYRVSVKPSGAVISAASDEGLVNGGSTLWQLMPVAGGALVIPAVEIEDAPRFAWRGIMLDSARHFQSPRYITTFIDWMSLHKLNVLHWHLTDDQAWRIEIRKYPKLTQVGAWRVPAGAALLADIDAATGKPRLYGGFYTQEEVRAIVAYAAERAITVIPEIEMPGHATAATAAYPQVGANPNPSSAVPADWGVYPNVYNLEESTFTFIEDVLGEVMDLFPSTWIHVGGDEVETAQWRDSPRTQVRMRELGITEIGRIQPYFTQRIGRFLQTRGRRLVGWDEILEPGLSTSAVVMSWRGIDGALTAAAKGYDTVLAAHPILYFDNRQASAASEPPGRGRIVSLQDVYAFEPMPPAIAENAAHHVLGLQANLWAEHIRTEDRMTWMAFPRAAAVAELGWSQPERRNWDDFRKRLTNLEARYPSVGLKAAKAPSAVAANPLVRKSQELQLCSKDIDLSLEDDAPLKGARAAFLVDVQNPCWIFPQAPLDRVKAIVASVGQVPFNFQIGEAVKKISFPQATTPEGELEVRVDSCEGELIARLPLAPAAASNGVTRLPAAPITARRGRHDLCLRFAQRVLDPMWVIDTIRIEVAK